ncbi:hypothetical protein X801_09022 [Opisthorchis viverrini]|uniref:Uncharacterized protein n=1 Tax=Opisthorchis viverrini TaxID=6198 RepID=A0A1S8WL72_OPIVI|nr:hypothetical protein X801_09022 [Opisthorchis viverrini]
MTAMELPDRTGKSIKELAYLQMAHNRRLLFNERLVTAIESEGRVIQQTSVTASGICWIQLENRVTDLQQQLDVPINQLTRWDEINPPRQKSRAFLSARPLDHEQSAVKKKAPTQIMQPIPASPNDNLSTPATNLNQPLSMSRRKEDLVRVSKEKVSDSGKTIIFGRTESEATQKGTVRNKQTKISADTDVYHFAKKMKQQKSLEELRVYTAKLYRDVKCFCDRIARFTDLCRKTEQMFVGLGSVSLVKTKCPIVAKNYFIGTKPLVGSDDYPTEMDVSKLVAAAFASLMSIVLRVIYQEKPDGSGFVTSDDSLKEEDLRECMCEESPVYPVQDVIRKWKPFCRLWVLGCALGGQ